jgi:hypothetical protein
MTTSAEGNKAHLSAPPSAAVVAAFNSSSSSYTAALGDAAADHRSNGAYLLFSESDA